MFGDPVTAGPILVRRTHLIVISTVGYISVVQPLRTFLAHIWININRPHPLSRHFIRYIVLGFHVAAPIGGVDPEELKARCNLHFAVQYGVFAGSVAW